MPVRLKFAFWIVLMTILLSVSLVAATPLLAAPIFAQSSVPVLLPPLDLAGLLAQALVFGLTLLGGWATSPATTLVVSLLKRAVPWSSQLLALIVGLILLVIVAVGAKYGVEAQVRQGISLITGILGVIAGTQINLTQSAKLYNQALAVNAPITSFQRDANPATTQAVAAQIAKAA